MITVKFKTASLRDGELVLTPADYSDIAAARRFCYELKANKTYMAELKLYREKRSLNANAYAWCLIGKIADAVRLDKEAVYKDMLKHYGQGETVSVRADINVSGLFRYYDVLGESELKGQMYRHYRVYKGSSEYDTREMSVLIDGIVHEAKQLDIETLTPVELERMKLEWK